MKRINLFDALIFLIIICFVVFGYVYLTKQEKAAREDVLLTVTINDQKQAKVVLAEAKKADNIYFSGLGKVSKVSRVEEIRNEAGGLEELKIQIEGQGSVEVEQKTFEGLKIIEGQKAEIHGPFFAQGVVSEIREK